MTTLGLQVGLQPHTHDMPPQQLARLLEWLLGESPQPGASLPSWLPDLVASCPPTLGSNGSGASNGLVPGCIPPPYQ